MTYSELLHTVSFDEIAPCLKVYMEQEESILGYKIHYDMLRLMQPVVVAEDKSSVINVEMYPRREGDRVPEGFMKAWPLEGEIWENALAKEIVVADDITASLPKIAACCLWHSSFYGFVEEDHQQTLAHWDEETQKSEYAHFMKLYGEWIPSPNQLLKIKKTMHNRVRHEMRHLRTRNNYKDEDEFLPTPTKWRKWKRWVVKDEYRRIVTGIGRFVERISDTSQPAVEPGDAHEFITNLLHAPSAYIDTLQSYTGDSTKRIDYIRELLDKYKALPKELYHRAIFCVYVSLDYDLKTEELAKLTDGLFDGIDQLAWGLKYDDNVGPEIRIDIALY